MPDKHKVPSFYWFNAYACFEEASREGSCKPAHWGLHFMQTPSVEVYVGQTEMKNLASHRCVCMFMKKLPVKAQASLSIGTVSPGPRI